MRRTLAPWERRVLNRLTTIKLALQILDRKTGLSDRQRALARAALEATDGLMADLVERWQAERDESPSRGQPEGHDLGPGHRLKTGVVSESPCHGGPQAVR